MKNQTFTPHFCALLLLELIAVISGVSTVVQAQDNNIYRAHFQTGFNAGEDGGAFSLFQGDASLGLGDLHLEFNAQMADRHGYGQRIAGLMIAPHGSFFSEALRVEIGIGAAVHNRSVKVTDLSQPVGSESRERNLSSMTAFQFRTKLATKVLFGEGMVSISPLSQFVQAEIGGLTKGGMCFFVGYNSVSKKMIGVRKKITFDKVDLAIGGGATIANDGNGAMLSLTATF